MNLPIDSTFKLNKDLVYLSNDMKERIEGSRNIFEVLFNQSLYIFKVKSPSENANW